MPLFQECAKERKERQFDWADIADAFEAGAKWMAKLPPYNAVLSPPTFKPTLDEKKIRELLESSEMHSRFNFRDYLEQNIIESYLKRKDHGADLTGGEAFFDTDVTTKNDPD